MKNLNKFFILYFYQSFKWKLKTNLEEDLDNLSMSSVNTADLSEYEI